MFQFNPKDPGEIPYKLRRIIREAGFTLQQICDRLEAEYGVELSQSSLSRSITQGTLQFQRVLEILAICGVTDIEIQVD
jgi:hypothetical protein